MSLIIEESSLIIPALLLLCFSESAGTVKWKIGIIPSHLYSSLTTWLDRKIVQLWYLLLRIIFYSCRPTHASYSTWKLPTLPQLDSIDSPPPSCQLFKSNQRLTFIVQSWHNFETKSWFNMNSWWYESVENWIQNLLSFDWTTGIKQPINPIWCHVNVTHSSN